MTKKSVKEKIKLENEIRAYGNGMFLTVNYPVSIMDGYDKLGKFVNKSRVEYRFQLVLRDKNYKRVKHWFFEDDRFYSEDISKEFTMEQVAQCRKYWLKVRNKPLPKPEWIRW